MFKTIRLIKKKAGFGMDISNNAEVTSLGAEADGSDGPAKAAGVVLIAHPGGQRGDRPEQGGSACEAGGRGECE